MPSNASHFAPLRFCSGELPERDRIPFCREVFGRNIVRLDVEPCATHAFRFDATLRSHPGLRIASYSATPGRLNRSKATLADGNDDLALIITRRGKCAGQQRRREVILDTGDAVLISHNEPGIFVHADSEFVGLVVPRIALAPLVANIEDATGQRVPRGFEAARLLCSYLAALRDDIHLVDPELCNLVVTHVHDLMAMGIGATRDGSAIALQRGVRAARLQAVKADIRTNLRDQGLSVSAVAKRQGVSPRYIHRLFENEGSTFTQFVLAARLDHAMRLLTAPRLAHRNIAAVAFAAGFGDLSYFNRTFRRRYGASPSNVRGEALARSGS